MSGLLHINNEIPELGEWDSYTHPTGTVDQSAEAAFPEHGALGLRCTNKAHVRKDLTTATIDSLGELYVGWWNNVRTFPSASFVTRSGIVGVGGSYISQAFTQVDAITFRPRHDGGQLAVHEMDFMLVDQWHYYVLNIRRAEDAVTPNGWYKLYFDGGLMNTWEDVDNFDLAAEITNIRIGNEGTAGYGYVADFDDIYIDTDYPEPFVPEPLTDYPEARRTVVLVNPTAASTDEIEYGDYCVTRLGIPHSNICPLPNAGISEVLADEATYQTEIETDLTAWLARNPTVAANVTTFHLGHLVPGYFTDGLDRIAIPSRLMHHGSAFSKEFNNPLVQTLASASRITATDLTGYYLVTRIDPGSLAQAKGAVDVGVNVTGRGRLPNADYFLCDDSDVLASLTAQRTRLQRAASYTDEDAVIMAGDIQAMGGDATSGSRALIIESAGLTTHLLRGDTSYLAYGMRNDDWAGGVGFSQLPADGFDVEVFLEVLRIGGTLAEAVMRSVEHLDYTAVPAGIPTLQLDFSTNGYNLYAGTPNAVDIDWLTPVAYLRSDATTASITVSPVADTVYKYGLRAVRDDVETPDIEAIAEFVTDGGADWLGNRPAPALAVTVEAEAGGVLRVLWDYEANSITPDDFALWHGTDSDVDTSGAPDGTDTYLGQRQHQHTFTLTDGTAYWIAIAAREGSVESQVVTVGPTLADSTAPTTPDVYANQAF